MARKKSKVSKKESSRETQKKITDKPKITSKRKTLISNSVLIPTDNNKKITEKLGEANVYPCDPNSTWIIIELNENTFLEEHCESIERSIDSILGPNVKYFLPVYYEKVQGKNSCYVLCEGYFFIERTDSIVSNIFSLRSEHIKGPLFIDNSLRLVTGNRINKLKKDLQDKIRALIPEKGQIVVPKIGVFKDLEGIVLTVDKNKLIAIVRFEKPSRIVDAPINVVNLSIVSGKTCAIS